MKHFLPSSVMLTPFVVRHNDEDDESENAFTLKTRGPDSEEQSTEHSE